MSAREFWRGVLDSALRHGPAWNPAPLPVRGDAVEQWLKRQRDEHSDRYGRLPAWYAVDELLDAYRLHAHTRTPLDQHVCEGGNRDDCGDNSHPF